MPRSAIRHALVRAWPVRLLATASAALALAGRPAAEPGGAPGRGSGARPPSAPARGGGVRHRAGAGLGTVGDLTVAVRLEPAAAGSLPLATGDRLPVAITTGTTQPYLVGTVGLAWSGAALEGSLRLAAPFPAGFPALAAGAVVAVGRPVLHARAPRAGALTSGARHAGPVARVRSWPGHGYATSQAHPLCHNGC